jgi:hypothetical protein
LAEGIIPPGVRLFNFQLFLEYFAVSTTIKTSKELPTATTRLRFSWKYWSPSSSFSPLLLHMSFSLGKFIDAWSNLHFEMLRAQANLLIVFFVIHLQFFEEPSFNGQIEFKKRMWF